MVSSVRSRQPARRRSWPRRIFGWIVRFILGFILLSLLMVVIYRFVPPPITLTQLNEVAHGHMVTKDWMPLAEIDPNMARAAISAEDGNFCGHHGFDLKAIQKAYQGNEAGRKLRGGSTISQQTAKNVFLWQGRSYLRKGLEAWFTVLIEQIWGKRRIMEVYLNVAETGIHTYGVNAGAQRYFHHDAGHLTPVEAARIAAVLPQPSERAAVAPHGQVLRYGNRIQHRIGIVQRGGYDRCLR